MMEVKNRIVMAPMGNLFATTEGAVTSRHKAYYEERAKGGVGLIIVEGAYVDRSGRATYRQLGIYDEELIPGLKELVDIIHAHGAKAALQITHCGRQTDRLHAFGLQPVAPSPIPCKCPGGCHETPKELTVEEIKHLLEAFGEGARRTKEADFDAVEIQGAHGYLISEFVSPYTNKRTDEYGGNAERRVKFPLEVVTRVRDKVGTDFPVLYRMNADDFVEGGLTLEDAKLVAKRLEGAGVNAIDVSAGIHESAPYTIPYMTVPRGHLLHLSKGIREVVDVPVIAAGGIDYSLAEKAIQDGMADLVAFGRMLRADPYLPKKMAEGNEDDTRKCIRCKRCRVEIDSTKSYVSPFPPEDRLVNTCTVNAMLGKEGEYRIEPVKKPKKILVVGGGVAGMEAARVAAMRGHHVTLCEKSFELGGQVLLGSKVHGKAELRSIADYLARQMDKLNVDVKLNYEVDLERVNKINPEVLIVATGAVPIIPSIPGVDQPHVVTSHDVLAGRAETGEKILIVGGGLVGSETAIFLAEKVKKVTIIEMLDRIATDLKEEDARDFLLEMISRYNVKVVTNAKVREIKGNSVVIERLRRGLLTGLGIKETIKDVDTVVLAVGSRSERRLADALIGTDYRIYAIGDCENPRRTLEAIHEGFQIALRI